LTRKIAFKKKIEMARTKQTARQSTKAVPRMILVKTAAPKNREKCRALSSLLCKYMRQPRNCEFLVPVDPERDGCANYLEVIKRPMDFGTIKNQLFDGSLCSISEFSDKMRLVFTNCMEYNRDDSKLFQIAKTQLQIFEADIDHLIEEFGAEEFEKSTVNKLRDSILHPNSVLVLKILSIIYASQLSDIFELPGQTFITAW
jgi:hypothetical protein